MRNDSVFWTHTRRANISTYSVSDMNRRVGGGRQRTGWTHTARDGKGKTQLKSDGREEGEECPTTTDQFPNPQKKHKQISIERVPDDSGHVIADDHTSNISNCG